MFDNLKIMHVPTLAALVNLSPDSPTQIFKHSLRILTSRIGFFVLSFSFLADRTTTFLVFLAACNFKTRQ